MEFAGTTASWRLMTPVRVDAPGGSLVHRRPAPYERGLLRARGTRSMPTASTPIAQPHHESTSDRDALDRLADLAHALGAERVARDARALADRTAEGRFHVACVGQFKRGKSTLINALVDRVVLPTAVLPVTALPTVVRYGPMLRARVLTLDGHWHEIAPDALADYVSEERNPANARGAALAEVFVPSPLLATGLCLVDTPGLGSVFGHNAETTRAFLPHIDAALVVIGADPPLSGDELRLMESVAAEVPHLIVVMNKVDRVSDADRGAAAAFAYRVLSARIGRPVGAIHAVSATERLAHAGPSRDWDALLASLERLAHDAGHLLVADAVRRGRSRIARALTVILVERHEALERPIADSEQRVTALSRTVAEAEDSLDDLRVRMAREQQRLARRLDARRDAFLADAIPAARGALADAMRTVQHRFGPAYRRDAMALARRESRTRVLPWLAAEEPAAQAEYRETAERFAEMTNAFLARVAALGGEAAATLPRALDPAAIDGAPPRFQFHEMLRLARPASPIRWLADAALGMVAARGVIARDVDAFLVQSLTLNAGRVRNDLEQRVSERRRTLEAEIRLVLREVSDVAARALDAARVARQAGEEEVREALVRTAALEAEVAALGGVAPDAAAQDEPSSRNSTSSPAT